MPTIVRLIGNASLIAFVPPKLPSSARGGFLLAIFAYATFRQLLTTVGRDASRLFPNGLSRLQELPTLRQDANELRADCGAEVRLVPADVVRTLFVLSIRPKVVAGCTRD
jgi:hypothetical protein